ncbi:hypothetical protein BDR06DRAFT_878220, partial [Suillus hirtellus]
LILSVFKTLMDQQVNVELKIDILITEVLKSVNQRDTHIWCLMYVLLPSLHIYICFYMVVKNCFIHGSVMIYVQFFAEHVDTHVLKDVTQQCMILLCNESIQSFQYSLLNIQRSLPK